MADNYDLPLYPSVNGLYFQPPVDHTFVGDSYVHGTTAVSGVIIMGLVVLQSGSIWGLADADVNSDTMIGIACATVNSGDTVNIITPPCIARDDTWTWVAGQPVYLSATPSMFTGTSGEGALIRKLGYAYNADNIYFTGYGATL